MIVIYAEKASLAKVIAVALKAGNSRKNVRLGVEKDRKGYAGFV